MVPEQRHVSADTGLRGDAGHEVIHGFRESHAAVRAAAHTAMDRVAAGVGVNAGRGNPTHDPVPLLAHAADTGVRRWPRRYAAVVRGLRTGRPAAALADNRAAASQVSERWTEGPAWAGGSLAREGGAIRHAATQPAVAPVHAAFPTRGAVVCRHLRRRWRGCAVLLGHSKSERQQHSGRSHSASVLTPAPTPVMLPTFTCLSAMFTCTTGTSSLRTCASVLSAAR